MRLGCTTRTRNEQVHLDTRQDWAGLTLLDSLLGVLGDDESRRVVHAAISRHAERARISKRRLVEDALRLWEKNRLALLAKEGYQRMAAEDERDAEAYLLVLDELEEG